jgi:Ca2+-binding RTX toxin-like protein
MVVRNVIGSVVTDLNNAADNYGLSADRIYVLDGRARNIATYGNNDLIDFRQNAQQNGTVSIYAGSGNDIVYGDTGTQYCYDGSGTDYLNLGVDNDSVGVGYGNDIYIGGQGTDLIMFYWTNFDGYEGAYTDNRTDITVDLALTSRQDFGIFGHDIISGFENVKCGNGDDTAKGNGGANGLYGYGGNDTLYGRSGSDTLDGGTGHDFLLGGKGVDSYYYAAIEDGGDSINRFTSLDKFVFEGAGFGNLVSGVLHQNEFLASGTGAATTPWQRFIYNTSNDTLWYDSNGNGAGGKVLIAHMLHDSTVTYDDITIV